MITTLLYSHLRNINPVALIIIIPGAVLLSLFFEKNPEFPPAVKRRMIECGGKLLLNNHNHPDRLKK